MSIEIALTVTLISLLAWANGANDIAKGVATLVGSGTTKAHHAIIWGTLCTVAGGLTALFWGAALIKTFSTGYLNTTFAIDTAFIISTISGAVLWVGLATQRGLPVSTTHALLGGLIGAAWIGGGFEALKTSAITNKAILPLLVGPLIAILLTSLFILSLRFINRNNINEDENQHHNHPAWTPLHWLSSGVTSFARGLNDTPKIAAFLILALSLSPSIPAEFTTELTPAGQIEKIIWPILLVTIIMGLGCLWGGFKVLDRLAYQITNINHHNGTIANTGTALLVLAASPLGLPVSTTHVSSGSLMGVRWSDQQQPEKHDAIKMILFGWVITLPITAIFAATTMALLQYSQAT